jgi:hypothetical protein
MKGAPLRFAGAVIGGWVVGRVVALSPVPLPEKTLGLAPVRAAAPIERPGGMRFEPMAPRVRSIEDTSRSAAPAHAGVATALPRPVLPGRAAPQEITESSERPLIAQQVERPVSPPLLPVRAGADPAAPRLAIDGWLVARPSGDTLAFGQLGGSQAGARLTYAVDRDRRIALSARISAPLAGRGREAGLGIDIRPGAAPVHLLFEQRFALDGGKSRPAVTIIAGGSTALPARLRVDVYAQGGAVWRRGGFADGAAVASRTVAEHAAARLELGGGLWGAAQRRLGRLDVGPSAALIAPVAGKTLRLQLDYRLRVAGKARPGSGPALTLGGSF